MTDPNSVPLPSAPNAPNNGATPNPQTPQNTGNATPQYGQYGTPAPTSAPQPEYGAYGAPAYGNQPAQPAYGQYDAGAGTPSTPAYGQTVPPQPNGNPYASAQPSGQYGQPAYGQPGAPQYQSAPAAPGYGQQQPYAQPAANPYDQNPYGGQSPYNQAPPSYGQYAAPSVPAGPVPLDQPYYGCPFPEAFLRFWKKYIVFSGRASRSEYWWWTLAASAVNIVLNILSEATDDKLAFLATLWALATLIPGIALAVRRLHDIDKPGWWVAIFYGSIVIGAILMTVGAGTAIWGGLGGFAAGDYSNHYGTAAAGGLGIAVIGALLTLAAGIVFIVFMALPSKPEGARFDVPGGAGAFGAPAGPAAPAAPANGYAPQYGAPAPAPEYGQQVPPTPAPAVPTVPEYGQPAQSAPAAPQYGQSTQPVYGQPAETPAAPAASVPLPDYGQTAQPAAAPSPAPTSEYSAPADEPVSDATVLSPHEPTSPTPAAPASDDDNAQKPWQGQ
ncbi:DUF805 domain-containing protein [Bifidobacterium callitrichidarum]|uniref:DUF805 domain-containing protein n=1 Tax=Bifidobacterium callitrichidarum TaxID=2052941 RepID=A0A2U2NA60_9BIFI|nr:DUF805 domain-containing protein [Bifidobacterium callitrichidarum]PWG65977.1 DUF805 domain-containing protein [Bifidobacterium callitrichidarum]